MKKTLFTISLSILLFACSKSNNYEYKVLEFQREVEFHDDPKSYKDWKESGSPINKFEKTLNEMGEQGWEYAGVITANGINGRYIAFKRLK